MIRRSFDVRTLWCALLLVALTVSPAAARLWTLQNGNDTVKIEDTSTLNATTGMYQSPGMSYWTMNSSTVDRAGQQAFWYRIGPDGGQLPLAALPVSSTKAYVSTPITNPATVPLTYTDTQFSCTVEYTLTGATATNKNSTLLKRVTIKNLTATPLELHLYHFSDFDVRYTAATKTVPQVDYDTAAFRGGKAFQTSYTGTAADGTTVVQTTTEAASLYDVDSDAAIISILEDPNYGMPLDLSNLAGPLTNYDGTPLLGDMQFGMQWDLSVPANGSISFDIVDNVYPSKPVNVTKGYSGTCVTNGQQVVYQICYNNTSNPALALTNGRLEYFLDQTTFVSATNSGVYDTTTKKVTWTFPSIAANAPSACVSVTGKSDNTFDSKHVIDFWADQAFPTTIEETVPLCNHAPVITSIPGKTATEGTAYTYQVIASDQEGTALTYSLASAPVGMSIGATTGTVTWKPAVGQAGTYTITIGVSDGTATTTQSYSLVVSGTNRPPVISSTPVTTATEGQLYQYQVKATDPDGQAVKYTVIGPVGMTINSGTGLISWTPAIGDAGTRQVIVTATDMSLDALSVSQQYSLVVSPAPVLNNPPRITSTPVINATENAPYTYQVVAVDTDPGEVLGYSVTGAPSGMAINTATGLISWLPGYADAGLYNISVQVTDKGGLTATQNYTLSVVNVNRVPVFNSSPITAGTVGNPYSYLPSVSDPDGDTIVSYAVTGPSGMSINTLTGLINWNPTAAGTFNVTVTATDSNNGVGSQAFTVVVTTVTPGNNAPVITSSAPTAAVVEGGSYLYRLVATDADKDTLTYGLAAGAPVGMMINSSTGLITWLPDYTNVGVWNVTATVSDGRGGIATQTFKVTVANVPPAFTTVPVTTGTDGAPYYYMANATDDGGAKVTISLVSPPGDMMINTQGVVGWGNPVAGTYTITLNATDGKAITSQIYTLTINHVNRPPVIDSTPLTNVNEGSTFTYTVHAADPDGDKITYSLVTPPAGMTINAATGVVTWVPKAANIGTVPVTVAASDGTTTVTQSFTLTVKEMAPVFSSVPVTVGTAGTPYSYTAVAADPGGLAISYTLGAGAPAGMSLNGTTGVLSWASPTAGSFPISIVASDGKMTAAQTFTLVVSGQNVPPVITSVAPSAAVNEGSTYSYTVTATDTNYDALSYALSGAPAGMTINASTGVISWTPLAANIGTASATVTVSDGKGGSATQTFSVTVNNVPPVFTSVPVTSGAPGVAYGYTAVATDAGGAAVTYALAAGAPSGMTITASTGVITWTSPVLGTYPVTVTASDGRTTVSQPYTLTITTGGNAVAPIITSTAPSAAVNEGSSYSYQVVATDANGDVVTYSFSAGAPTGMSINGSTGLISWTPDFTQAGTYSVKVRATDPGGFFGEQTFSVVVNNVDRAPIITSAAPISATEGFPYSYQVVATDPDGDALTYSLSNAPSGMVINATGLVSWIPTGAQGGTNTATVSVVGASLGTTQLITVKVATIAHVPTITSTAPAGASVGAPYTYQVVATDPDAGTVLTYGLATAPAGMTINPTTGLVSWTPSAAGSFAVTVTVTDNTSLVASQDFSVTVTTGSSTNVAPVITSSAPVAAVNEGSVYTYQVTATDGNGDTLSYALAGGAPSGMSINPLTGLISWTPMAANVGTSSATVTVSDGKGGSTSQPFTVTVNNVLPTFISAPVTTGTAGTAYAYSAVATDAGGAAISYSLAAGAPAGMSISTTGVVSWASPVAGTYSIKVNAGDGKGTSTQTYSLVIGSAANIPPVINSTAPATTVNEGGTYTYDVNATDGDNDPLTYSLAAAAPAAMTIDPATGVITFKPMAANVGTVSATVNVSDGKATVSQTFTVTVANVAPAFSSAPVTTATAGSPYSYTAVATDAGGATITYSLAAGAPTGMAITSAGVVSWTSPVQGTYSITINAGDGRTTTPQTYPLTVTAQNTAPVISSVAPTAAVAEGSLYSYAVTAVDADKDPLTFGLAAGAPTGMTINATTGLISWTPRAANVGTASATVTVTDSKGATGSQTFSITVTNVAPVFTSTPVTAGTPGVSYRYTALAVDAGGATIVYSLGSGAPKSFRVNSSTGVASWTSPVAGTYTITINASDGKATTRQTYTLTIGTSTNAAPVITSSAPTAAVNEGGTYTYDVNATDTNGDTLTYALAAAPPGMTINGSTGVISWSPMAVNVGTASATVTVSDGRGGSVSQTFSVTVTNVLPTFTSTPVTTATAGTAYTYTAVATDAGGATITYTLASGAPTGMTITSAGTVTWPLPVAGTYPVTVNANDGKGTTLQSYTLTVDPGNTLPTITSTAPTAAVVEGSSFTYDVNATDANGDSLTYALAAGAPATMTINPSTGVISWTPMAANIGANPITVTVSDGKGSVSQAFTVTVTNASPVFTSTPVTAATTGTAYTYAAAATDAGGAAIVYSLAAGAPSGMTINATSGLVSWPAPVAGVYSIALNATDGKATTAQTYTLTVTGPQNRPPTITSTAPTAAVNEGSVYSYAVAATDPDGDSLTFALAAGAPVGMTISASGTVTWTPMAANVGAASVTVTVSDGKGGVASQTFSVTVGNVAPSFTSTPVTTGTAGTAYVYTAAATDAGGAALTYTLTTSAAGMTINATTGVVSWSAPVAGSYTVTVSASDGKSTTPQTFTLVIAAPPNFPPVITSVPVTTATSGRAYSYGVVASDPEGKTLVYSLTTRPSGMSISTSGVITWTPTSTGSYNVTVNVSDGSLAATQSFTITVAANQAPTISSTAVTSATVNKQYSYQVVASDPNGDALTYSLPTRPSGMAISSTGLITWTPTSTGSNSVTVRVSDGALTTSQSFTLNVISNQAPQITSAAPTLALVGKQYTYQVVATDANKDPLTYSLSTAQSGMTISSTGLITWTPTSSQTGSRSVSVRVSDGSTSTSQSFTVNVRTTNSAPVITTTSLSSATAGSSYSRTVYATDADGDRLTFSLAAAPAGMTISSSGTISWNPTTAQRGTQTVTVSVTDTLAVTTKTYTITVN